MRVVFINDKRPKTMTEINNIMHELRYEIEQLEREKLGLLIKSEALEDELRMLEDNQHDDPYGDRGLGYNDFC